MGEEGKRKKEEREREREREGQTTAIGPIERPHGGREKGKNENKTKKFNPQVKRREKKKKERRLNGKSTNKNNQNKQQTNEIKPQKRTQKSGNK